MTTTLKKKIGILSLLALCALGATGCVYRDRGRYWHDRGRYDHREYRGYHEYRGHRWD